MFGRTHQKSGLFASETNDGNSTWCRFVGEIFVESELITISQRRLFDDQQFIFGAERYVTVGADVHTMSQIAIRRTANILTSQRLQLTDRRSVTGDSAIGHGFVSISNFSKVDSIQND